MQIYLKVKVKNRTAERLFAFEPGGLKQKPAVGSFGAIRLGLVEKTLKSLNFGLNHGLA